MADKGMNRRLAPLGGGIGVRPATVLRRALYYWPWALLAFLLTLILGLAVLFLLPSPYKSEARLLALPGDYYAVRDDPERISGNESLRPEDVMNVEMQLLSSRDLKREALKRSGAAVAEDMAAERAIDEIDKDLVVLPVTQASTIELSYTADNAQDAQRMLETVLQSYFALRADVFTSGRLELLLRQRNSARDDLQKANQELSAFQRQNDVADVQEQIKGAVEIDTALRRELAESRALLSGSRGALTRERRAASRLPRVVEIYRDNTEATRARSEIEGQIVALQAERADLAQRYMEGSPLIEKIDTQIAGLRQSLTQASASLPEARRLGRSAAYEEATSRVRESESTVSRTSSRITQLQNEIEQSQARLQRLNALAVEISDLEVQREVAENRFRSIAAQVEEARSRAVEAGTGSANVRIIQQPTLPSSRVRSPLMLLASTVLIAGLLGVATALGLASLRDVPVDAQDAADSFRLPILADLRAQNGANTLPAPEMVRKATQSQIGQIVALVGATPQEYERNLHSLVTPFVEEGETAMVNFEPAAYKGTAGARQTPRLVAQHPDRYLIGSRTWLESDAGADLLEALQAKYRWILLFVPPGNSPMGEELQALATQKANEVLVAVHAGETNEQATRSLLGRLEALSRPVRGLVIVGRDRTLRSAMRRRSAA